MSQKTVSYYPSSMFITLRELNQLTCGELPWTWGYNEHSLVKVSRVLREAKGIDSLVAKLKKLNPNDLIDFES